eukprot:Skav211195  [mRNA]  locus=scaffold2111:41561:44854:- [translate_table: standard]
MGLQLTVGLGAACDQVVEDAISCDRSLPLVSRIACESQIARFKCPGTLLSKTFAAEPVFQLPKLVIDYYPDGCFWRGRIPEAAFDDLFADFRSEWLIDANFAGPTKSFFDSLAPEKTSNNPADGGLGDIYLFASPVGFPSIRIFAEATLRRSKLECRDRPDQSQTCSCGGGGGGWGTNGGGSHGFGDPQCLTYDGLRFECNFLGEVVWTKCDDFAVHVIAERPNNSSQATVITGFAVTEGREIVYALLRRGADRNSSSYDSAFDGDGEKLSGNHLFLTQEDEDTLLVDTALGHGLRAVFKPTHVYLEVNPDDRCFNRMEGLMGNYNGNSSDDLRPFNSGQSIASSLSPERIYENFVLSWCRDDFRDSLFPAELFRPCERSSWPLFAADLDLDVCPASCQGDSFCCLDFSEGGEELALESVDLQAVARSFLDPDPPTLSLPTEIFLPYNSPGRLRVTAQGADIDSLNCSVCSLQAVACSLTLTPSGESDSGTLALLEILGESLQLVEAGPMICTVEANGIPTIGGAILQMEATAA